MMVAITSNPPMTSCLRSLLAIPWLERMSSFEDLVTPLKPCAGQVGVRCVRLEGSMSMEARDRMIDAFTNDPAVTVFLMSLKAGGVALNLTAASHVMLLDPWWCAAAGTTSEVGPCEVLHHMQCWSVVTKLAPSDAGAARACASAWPAQRAAVLQALLASVCCWKSTRFAAVRAWRLPVTRCSIALRCAFA